MTIHSDPRNPGLHIGDELSGFRVQKITALEEIDAVLYSLEHTATGARYAHISRKDNENAFSVTFKTVPGDSTGVAHILEHTVLCGSKKYPVRDPFFSMLKRSLSTFMNAFTSSDWTMYPFATQNTKDYYHLMDVYLDAAFFPLLDELGFKQEGHRLEFADAGEEVKEPALVYKGVVYNEMKGAMSSADQVMSRSMLKALYPDTTYGNNSGGDPEIIPQLSHAQLRAFHQRHYHPSNAYFYTYGSLALKDHLAFIEEKVMQRFSRIDPGTDVAPQPRWLAPKTVRFTYPLAPGEDTSRKCQASLAWLTCDVRDTFEVLVLTVLEQILIANAGSPLRKALMDSGLGSALSDATGYDGENRDTFFSCGLKDVEENAAEAVEKLILEVLGRLVKEGIDRELVDSAIHQIEFHRKEITNSPYPYGLRLLLTVLGSWLHGGDPERILKLDSDLQRFQEEMNKGPFLEQKLKAYFLDNPHRVRMILAPDQEKAEKEEKRVRLELSSRLKQLSEKEQEKIRQDALALVKLQESQEDISCLPTLALSDIAPEVQTCPPTAVEPGLPIWRYIQSTSGIFYFKAAAGVASVPETLLPWTPFFCYAFNQIGTRRFDYSAMARRIDAATGGFSLSSLARMQFEKPGGCVPMVNLSAKCLSRNISATIDIIEELIAEADFDDLNRLKQLVGEYHSGLESMIVQNGHRLAISLSSRTFSQAGALSEIWGGVQQVRFISGFVRQLNDKKLKELAAAMAAIKKAVFAPENVLMAAIGDQQQVDAAIACIKRGKTLSTFKRVRQTPNLPTLERAVDKDLPFEGWSTSSAVAFVAQTIPTVTLKHADAPALTVFSKMLRSLYLHREIREKGGAYGGFALYNPENGLFSLASYRDPHIARTLNVYNGVADYLEKSPISDEDLKESILQVCSEIDKPDPPGPSARKAFARLIVGLDDETRLAFKKQLLGLTMDAVLSIAKKYFQGAENKAGVAVIAGREQLDEANNQLSQKKLLLNTI